MGTLNATYTFAAPAAAKYVSESIDAGIAWINQFPHDMLGKTGCLHLPSAFNFLISFLPL